MPRKLKLLSKSELDARIQASSVLVENAHKNDLSGFHRKAIAQLLFRYDGLENYQPIYISLGAKDRLGDSYYNMMKKQIQIPRSNVFRFVSDCLTKMGYDRKDFVVEHVVDVSTMVNSLFAVEPNKLKEHVISLGRSCPLCIVTKEEDRTLKSYNRNNLCDIWSEYYKNGIDYFPLRKYCGPLLDQ